VLSSLKSHPVHSAMWFVRLLTTSAGSPWVYRKDNYKSNYTDSRTLRLLCQWAATRKQ